MCIRDRLTSQHVLHTHVPHARKHVLPAVGDELHYIRQDAHVALCLVADAQDAPLVFVIHRWDGEQEMCIRDSFTVMEIDEQGAAPVALLSRTQAQQRCKAEYLDLLLPGDILPCRVTHLRCV